MTTRSLFVKLENLFDLTLPTPPSRDDFRIASESYLDTPVKIHCDMEPLCDRYPDLDGLDGIFALEFMHKASSWILCWDEVSDTEGSEDQGGLTALKRVMATSWMPCAGGSTWISEFGEAFDASEPYPEPTSSATKGAACVIEYYGTLADVNGTSGALLGVHAPDHVEGVLYVWINRKGERARHWVSEGGADRALSQLATLFTRNI